MDNSLPFLVGTIEAFEASGISLERLRKSVDGTKAMIHMQNLNGEQMAASWGREGILPPMTKEDTDVLMATPEWTVEEVR